MASKTAKKPAAGSLQKAAKPVKRPFALKNLGAKAPKLPVSAEVKTAKLARLDARPASLSFTLEDAIDIPARKRTGGASPYPFASMASGQSFFVAAEVERGLYTSESEADGAQLEECRRVANRLTGAVRRFMKAHKDASFKFTVRTVADPHGVRVWRTDGAGK